MEVGFFETVARDLSGEGQFRLILQPLAALILGTRLGLPFVGTRALTNRIWRRVRAWRLCARPRTA